MDPLSSDVPLRDVFEAIAQRAAAASDGVVRVAVNEHATSRSPDPSAQRFLKIHEQRVGRDFRLIEFLGAVAGVGHALGEFAEMMILVEEASPQAYMAVVNDMKALRRYLPEGESLQSWDAIWEDAITSPQKTPRDG